MTISPPLVRTGLFGGVQISQGVVWLPSGYSLEAPAYFSFMGMMHLFLALLFGLLVLVTLLLFRLLLGSKLSSPNRIIAGLIRLCSLCLYFLPPSGDPFV